LFRDLLLARIIEPTSKLEGRRVLTEAGITASYRTLNRRLPVFAKQSRRQGGRGICAHAGLGSMRLALYDVSTLYTQIDERDGTHAPAAAIRRPQ
jgi:hypothetical protein